MEIQKKVEATVLIKWDGTKIIVPIPFEVVNNTLNSRDILLLNKGHAIRSKSVNERYEYNSTDEIDIYILQNHTNHYHELIKIVEDRRKSNLSVSKEVINKIAEDRFNK